MEHDVVFQQVDKNEIKSCHIPCVSRPSLHSIELKNMSRYLTQAVLLEVCTHPKPGLVTRFSNGSHRDMSILTFAMSSAVLSSTFKVLQDIGMSHKGTAAELMEKVRSYGISAEQELLGVTKGVNTQRGILFAEGVLSAASGYAVFKGTDKKCLLDVVKEMTSGLVEKELQHKSEKAPTAGEMLYKKYGITGIRGEVEQGFPSVVNEGLPALYEAFERGACINDAFAHALVNLMTIVEDSNVIWRAGISAAEDVKKTAFNILKKGSIFTSEGREALGEAEKYFKARWISPGGSADLLSIAISLYLLKNKEFPVKVF